MKPDIEKYRRYVDKFDLPESDKVELIESLWIFMGKFVDQAFGVNPDQQAIAERTVKCASASPPVLELKAETISHKSLKTEFKRKA